MTVTIEEIALRAARPNTKKVELDHAVALTQGETWTVFAKIPDTETAEYVGICKDSDYIDHLITIVDRAVAHVLKAGK